MKIYATIIMILGLILNISSISQAQESTTNVGTPPAKSEQADTTTTTAASGQQVERVEVIGSRIKRIQKEGATAVKSVNKDSMKNSANTTASDSLRDTTAATYGAAREASGGSAAATATIGLRGFGDTRTLVLLNGHRLPKDPSAEAVDLNLIPQSAIERIEILKDGASALYGSDALGGVVNIVTKKGYTGTEASSKISTYAKAGGTIYDISLLSGISTERVDFLATLSHQHKDKIFGKDRAETRGQLSSTGAVASYKNTASPWATGTDCPQEYKKKVGAGFKCYFPFNSVATITPQIAQTNLLTDLTYRFDSGLKLYNRNLVVYKDISWSYAPTPGTFANNDPLDPAPINPDELPNGTALHPGPPGAPGAAQQLGYRYLDAGNRDTQNNEINFSTLVGAKGSVTSVWEYDLSVGYSEINRNDRGTSGYLDKKVLIDAIAAGTHDPTAPVGSPLRDLPAGSQVQIFQKAQSKLFSTDLVVTGELGEMADGPIGIATGISFYNEKLKQDTDELSLIPNRVIGGAGSKDSGNRDIQSFFLEAGLPLTKSLELDAAARLDHYSDFGTTVNPKLSVKYALTNAVLIRSSVGTGFKAPTLSQLYGAASDGYPTFIDRNDPLCKADAENCTADQHHVFGGGNEKLKEEKSFSASLGTVIQPHSDISFSIDGWYTKVNNIVSLDLEAATEAEANGANLANYGITVNRDSDGAINYVIAPNLNLASEAITGIDFNMEIALTNNLLGHQLSFDNDFSYIVSDYISPFPGIDARNVVGEWGMPRWRNTASLSMKNDISTYSLTMRSIGKQNINDRETDEKISDLNEFDISGSYKIAKLSQVSFGIKNIMDAQQPLDSFGNTGGTPDYNSSLYDINGRKFFVSFTQKF